MKRTFCAALTISFAIFSITVCSCKKSDKDKEEGDEKLLTVDVATPEIDSVMLRKTFPGFITANKEVNLVARVNGTLTAHPYEAGQYVEPGATLFLIDSKVYENDVKQAQASLDNARSSYEYYSKQYGAMKIALESDAVSEMEVLEAKSNMDQAAAQIKNYEAALQNAMTTLGYCTIRAPFAGRVSLWNYDVGNYIAGQASPVTLATIYDDAIVFANVEIDNATYSEMMNSISTDLDLSAIPVKFENEVAHQYTADLTYMAPDIDKTTGTILIRAAIKNPHGELKSGMLTSIEVPYNHLDKAVIIEDAAIGTDQLGKYIYTVNDSNQIIYTPVEVGQVLNGTKRIVTKGLKPDTRYVTKALLKVRNGEKVNPVMK